MQKKLTFWTNLALKNIWYSFTSIRQNYNFDKLATIWREIVSWFLMFSQYLRNMISKMFVFFEFHISAEQFYARNKQEWGKTRNQQTISMSNDGSSMKIIERSHSFKTSPRSYSNDLCAVKLISVKTSLWGAASCWFTLACALYNHLSRVQWFCLHFDISSCVFKMVEIATKIFILLIWVENKWKRRI